MDEFLQQLKMALESQTGAEVDIGDGVSGDVGVEFEGRHYDLKVTETE